MPNHPISLASSFNGQSILEMLGAPAASLRSCPICRCRKLHVLDDIALGGKWLFCGGCQFAGDLLELASRVWHREIPAVVDRLQAAGAGPTRPFTEEQVQGYIHHHVQPRARTLAFWRFCRQNLMADEPGSLSFCQCRISQYSVPDSFVGRGTRTMGLTSAHELDDFFHPATAPHRRSNRRSRQSGRLGYGSGRVFSGWHPREVWIVPFEDLPGRICGFWLQARNADESLADPMYKSVRQGSRHRLIQEAGIAMLSNAFMWATDQAFDTVIVIPNVDNALRLQFMWLIDHCSPLPLVAIHQDSKHQPNAVWELLRGKKIVVWDPTGDGYGFKLARRLDTQFNGSIPLNDRHFRDLFCRLEGILHRLQESPHWRSALFDQRP